MLEKFNRKSKEVKLMSDTNLNNKSACKFESKIKDKNKRIIPKGALLYISFIMYMCVALLMKNQRF